MNARLSIVLAFIIGLSTWTSANLNWGENYWHGTLEVDAKGYYAYLPAIFIYQDLTFEFFESVEKENTPPHFLYDYRTRVNQSYVNKYFIGTAILEAPFFLTAHAISLATDNEPNGYSKPYIMSITVAAIFYLFIGLLFLAKSLKTMGFSDLSIHIALLSVSFGTNLFYYTVSEPGMSHVYSFSLVAIFTYVIQKLKEQATVNRIVVISLVLGLTVLARPINLLIVLAIPFLLVSPDNLKRLISQLFRLRLGFALGIACLAILVFVQPLVYKLSTGTFFIYSYDSEGFNFLSPRFIEILFSYKKGLFLYTPMYLLMMLCSMWVYRKSTYSLFTFLAFLFVIIYVFSSWWNWWYGGSFSGRVFIEYLPVLSIPLVVLLNDLHRIFSRIIIYSLLFALVILCQFQTYQYRYGLIHWENMNKEMYWDNFLQLN